MDSGLAASRRPGMTAHVIRSLETLDKGDPTHGGSSAQSDLLRHLAQPEFLNFPRRGLRQLREHHVTRALIAREILAAPCNEILARDIVAGFDLDEGARCLAPLL